MGVTQWFSNSLARGLPCLMQTFPWTISQPPTMTKWVQERAEVGGAWEESRVQEQSVGSGRKYMGGQELTAPRHPAAPLAVILANGNSGENLQTNDFLHCSYLRWGRRSGSV